MHRNQTSIVFLRNLKHMRAKFDRRNKIGAKNTRTQAAKMPSSSQMRKHSQIMRGNTLSPRERFFSYYFTREKEGTQCWRLGIVPKINACLSTCVFSGSPKILIRQILLFYWGPDFFIRKRCSNKTRKAETAIMRRPARIRLRESSRTSSRSRRRLWSPKSSGLLDARASLRHARGVLSPGALGRT